MKGMKLYVLLLAAFGLIALQAYSDDPVEVKKIGASGYTETGVQIKPTELAQIDDYAVTPPEYPFNLYTSESDLTTEK